jgi:hypothetical protein
VTTTVHAIPGDSFVDDTTMGVTKDDTTMDPVPVEVAYLKQSEDTLIGQMQTIIQLCLDLLQVTGDDLDPEKCVWFLICNRWKNRKARLLTVQDYHRGIKITSRSTGNVSGVKRKGQRKGIEHLGFKHPAMASVLLKRRQ